MMQPITVACPSCKSDDIKRGWRSSTLLGWHPQTPENDPNHHTLEATCGACGLAFQKHWKVRNKSVWYTSEDGMTLLAGEPGCCERRWTPIACSGCAEVKICTGGSWTRETGWQWWCSNECRRAHV
jgi:hypothetical protein